MSKYEYWGERELIAELEKRDSKIKVILIEVFNENENHWEWYTVKRFDDTQDVEKLKKEMWEEFIGERSELDNEDDYFDNTRDFIINI
jgi:hypothetical protein